jgi:hypothetical protein
MERTVLILFFSITLWACSTKSPAFYPTERYAVYAEILKDGNPWNQFLKVLIYKTTTKGPPHNGFTTTLETGEIVPLNDLRTLKNRWPDFNPEDFYNDFITRNMNTEFIDADSLHLKKPIEVVTAQDLVRNHYLQSDVFDNAILHSFSMPSFNRLVTDAVVYYQYTCGNSRSEGLWLWLKKNEGTWKVFRRVQAWAS